MTNTATLRIHSAGDAGTRLEFSGLNRGRAIVYVQDPALIPLWAALFLPPFTPASTLAAWNDPALIALRSSVTDWDDDPRVPAYYPPGAPPQKEKSK